SLGLVSNRVVPKLAGDVGNPQTALSRRTGRRVAERERLAQRCLLALGGQRMAARDSKLPGGGPGEREGTEGDYRGRLCLVQSAGGIPLQACEVRIVCAPVAEHLPRVHEARERFRILGTELEAAFKCGPRPFPVGLYEQDVSEGLVRLCEIRL